MYVVLCYDTSGEQWFAGVYLSSIDAENAVKALQRKWKEVVIRYTNAWAPNREIHVRK